MIASARLLRLARVARAAEGLMKCIDEFGDQLECCGEPFQELDAALAALEPGDLDQRSATWPERQAVADLQCSLEDPS
jgi:hypothetical protein